MPFDLPQFMFAHFNRVDFGGDLFGQWPFGIRFEIGFKQVDRAEETFHAAFAKETDCVLVSQDWDTGISPATKFTQLFATPGIFPIEPTEVQSLRVSPFDETPYRLSWTRTSPLDFNAAAMFKGIANREQKGSPKISSGVYAIQPSTKIIMQMYDDRGLDVIAVDVDQIRPLFQCFRDWILDNQRHRIESRFNTAADASK
ncbi:MAG TPA: DUF3885 domain-containing protein [Terracidiphilus sp.]|jgi:hypothetical protein